MHGILTQVTDFVPMLNVCWFRAMQITQLVEFVRALTNTTFTLDQALRSFILWTTSHVLVLGCYSSILTLLQICSIGSITVDGVLTNCLNRVLLSSWDLTLHCAKVVITMHKLITTVMEMSTLALWLLQAFSFPTCTVSFSGWHGHIGWIQIVVSNVGRLRIESLMLLEGTLSRWDTLLSWVCLRGVELGVGICL